MQSIEELFFEKQIDAYKALVQKVSDIDCIAELSGESLYTMVMNLLNTFRSSYLFLDDETIRVFNERILEPWINGEFKSVLERDDLQLIYDECRHRLNGEVLPVARAYFKHRFPQAFVTFSTSCSEN